MSKAKTSKKVEAPAKKTSGRPTNPNSSRQMKLVEQDLKREAGLLKRGRPAVEGSKRQAVMAAREVKKANGIEIKRGRPKVEKTEATK